MLSTTNAHEVIDVKFNLLSFALIPIYEWPLVVKVGGKKFKIEL